MFETRRSAGLRVGTRSWLFAQVGVLLLVACLWGLTVLASTAAASPAAATAIPTLASSHAEVTPTLAPVQTASHVLPAVRVAPPPQAGAATTLLPAATPALAVSTSRPHPGAAVPAGPLAKPTVQRALPAEQPAQAATNALPPALAKSSTPAHTILQAAQGALKAGASTPATGRTLLHSTLATVSPSLAHPASSPAPAGLAPGREGVAHIPLALPAITLATTHNAIAHGSSAQRVALAASAARPPRAPGAGSDRPTAAGAPPVARTPGSPAPTSILAASSSPGIAPSVLGSQPALASAGASSVGPVLALMGAGSRSGPAASRAASEQSLAIATPRSPTSIASLAASSPEPTAHGAIGRGAPPLSPPAQGPGGASGAGTGASTATSALYLALAALLLLGAPRALRRLRLTGEPWLTASFDLIPERPG